MAHKSIQQQYRDEYYTVHTHAIHEMQRLLTQETLEFTKTQELLATSAHDMLEITRKYLSLGMNPKYVISEGEVPR